MLETRLTELDLEFIKLWSEFLLEDNANAIMPKLKDLAMKGQINAIQEWYRFNEIGDCVEIDNITQNLKGLTYDELLAIARFNHTSKEQVESANILLKEWLELIDKCENNYHEEAGFRCTYKVWGDNTPFETRIKEIKDTEIPQKAQFVDYYNQAINKAYTLYSRTLNIYILEKNLEMTKTLQKTPYIGNGWLTKNIKVLHNEYAKALKTKQKQSKPYVLKATDDPQFFFHYSKSILLWDGNDKYRPYAVKFLNELAGFNNESEKQQQTK